MIDNISDVLDNYFKNRDTIIEKAREVMVKINEINPIAGLTNLECVEIADDSVNFEYKPYHWERHDPYDEYWVPIEYLTNEETLNTYLNKLKIVKEQRIKEEKLKEEKLKEEQEIENEKYERKMYEKLKKKYDKELN